MMLTNTSLHILNYISYQESINLAMISLLTMSTISHLSVTSDGEVNVSIACISPVGIIIVNSSNILITNITLKECSSNFTSINTMIDDLNSSAGLSVLNSWFITITLTRKEHLSSCDLHGINIFGESIFKNIQAIAY